MKNLVFLFAVLFGCLLSGAEDFVIVRLVRHGQPGVKGTVFTEKDKASWIRLGLTPMGREQARITGEFLKKEGRNYSVIIASPQERASETADILCSVLGKTFTLSPDLREVGNSIRETLPQLRKRFKNIDPKENMNLTAAQRKGFKEPDRAVGKRGKKFILDLVKSGVKGPVLLVTHGHFMYMTVREMTGKSFQPWNCGMMELKVDRNGKALLVKGAYPEVFESGMLTCNQTFFHKNPYFAKFRPHPGPRPTDLSFVEKEFRCLLNGENSSWRKNARVKHSVLLDKGKSLTVTVDPAAKKLSYSSPDFPVKAGKKYQCTFRVSGKGKGKVRLSRLSEAKELILTEKVQEVTLKFPGKPKRATAHIVLDILPGTTLTLHGFSLKEI